MAVKNWVSFDNKVILKFMLSKKCAPKLMSFNQKEKNEKDYNDFWT